MHAFLQWLKRLPLALWLFIAASQVIAVGFRLHDLAGIRKALDELADRPASVEIFEQNERWQSREQRRLASAVILSIASIGLAYWKWTGWQAIQFATKSILLATAFVAIWMGAILFDSRLYLRDWSEQAWSVTSAMHLWLPFVFVAYCWGRRALTWHALVLFAVAMMLASAVNYWDLFDVLFPARSGGGFF